MLIFTVEQKKTSKGNILSEIASFSLHPSEWSLVHVTNVCICRLAELQSGIINNRGLKVQEVTLSREFCDICLNDQSEPAL